MKKGLLLLFAVAVMFLIALPVAADASSGSGDLVPFVSIEGIKGGFAAVYVAEGQGIAPGGVNVLYSEIEPANFIDITGTAALGDSLMIEAGTPAYAQSTIMPSVRGGPGGCTGG